MVSGAVLRGTFFYTVDPPLRKIQIFEVMDKTGPTDKQVRYVLHLLDQAGFSTYHMDSRYKSLGATMHECNGLVEDWVRSKSRHEISRLIDRLLRNYINRY